MLLLGSTSMTIEGVTVFPDHANPNQFWYLPGPIRLAKRPGESEAAFTFIKYKPAAVEAGVKGGGFLMFDVNLRLDQATEQKIMSRLSAVAKGTPKLSVVQFDEGTVKCIALNLQGEGGTSAEAAPEGAFNAVESILGASVPSLQGDDDASFSLTLSQEGATIIEQAYTQGTAPVGIIYDLKFTGIRPALDVKITADFKRIYQSFSASLSGQYYFLKAGIEAAFEKLVQDGAIKVEVTHYVDNDDLEQKEKWALDFFKDKLLTEWFQPTLLPGQPHGAVWEGGGGTSSTPGSAATTHGTTPSSSTTHTTSPSTTPSSSTSGQGTTAGHGTSPATAHPAAQTRAAAQLTIVSKQPDPLPQGYNIEHTPSPTGTTETIRVTGSGTPTVTVDGTQRQLTAGALTIDVQPGTSHNIAVSFPAVAATEETFPLKFLYELPRETWVTGNPGTNANYQSYLSNHPNPDDPPFLASHAPSGTAPPGGADALRNWIQNSLVAPKEVELRAHASFEGDASQAKQDYNMRLSGRRLDVVRGIIGSLATITSAGAFGQTEAQQAGRLGQPDDRNVMIKGRTNAGSQGVNIAATLARQRPPATPTPTPTPTPHPTPTPRPQTPSVSGSPEVALKLRFVRQDEQKTVTFEYHRSDAVQRTYAPQGFFGLLLADLGQQDKHFVEVDLDDPFFRVFTVTLDAPIDFGHIGLISAQVALDYGEDAEHHKHGDFVFDADSHAQQEFKVFMDDAHDTSYSYGVQYHFDPLAGWDGHKLTYDFPAVPTEDRTLLLNPYEQMGFLEVRVFPHDIDGGVVESTDVFLSYTQPDGTVEEKILAVTATSDPQFWRLRLDDPKQRQYTYHFVHHLKDGSVRETDPVVTQATALPVDDPFDNPIDIDFIPLFDPTTVRTVFIDVQYDDPDNNYHREDRLTLQGNATDAVRLRISVVDPAKRTFRYRMTFVGTDNHMNRGPFVETTETLIGVAP